MKASNLFKRLIYPKANLNKKKMYDAFANHWVVVTGASRGIGEALVRRLIASHANLFLIARSEEQLHSLCKEAREAGCKADYCAIDLRDRERLDQLCQHLKGSLPCVDYLFWSAPFTHPLQVGRLTMRRSVQPTPGTRRHVRNCDDKVFPYRLLICHSFTPRWQM